MGCGKSVPYDDCKCLPACVAAFSLGSPSSTHGGVPVPWCGRAIVKCSDQRDAILVSLLVRFYTLKQQPHFRISPGTASPPSVAPLSTTILTFHEICSWFSICSIAFLWDFFTAVILIPTWSRVRYQGEGQRPLRSRTHPSGLPYLSPSSKNKVLKANNTLEIIAWASYLALQVSKRKTFSVPHDARRFRRSSCFWPSLPLGFGRFAKPRWGH